MGKISSEEKEVILKTVITTVKKLQSKGWRKEDFATALRLCLTERDSQPLKLLQFADYIQKDTSTVYCAYENEGLTDVIRSFIRFIHASEDRSITYYNGEPKQAETFHHFQKYFGLTFQEAGYLMFPQNELEEDFTSDQIADKFRVVATNRIQQVTNRKLNEN